MKVTYSDGTQEIWDPNNFRNHGLSKFQNWLCWAGSSSLNITAEGEVTAGICQSQNFGNIFKPETLSQTLSSSFVCPKEFCTASPDIEAKKSNPDSNGKIKHIEPTTKELCINWDITRHCNYDCWYCIPEFHDNSNFFRNKEELLSGWNNFTKNLLKGFQNTDVKLHVLGGEPTLHPDYIEILGQINSPNTYMITMTNGSNSLNYYKELLTYSHITISVHFEFIKSPALIKKIISLANYRSLNHPEKRLVVKIMAQPGKVDKAVDFYNCLYREKLNNLGLEVLNLRDPKTNHRRPVKYSEAEMEQLKNVHQ